MCEYLFSFSFYEYVFGLEIEPKIRVLRKLTTGEWTNRTFRVETDSENKKQKIKNINVGNVVVNRTKKNDLVRLSRRVTCPICTHTICTICKCLVVEIKTSTEQRTRCTHPVPDLDMWMGPWPRFSVTFISC